MLDLREKILTYLQRTGKNAKALSRDSGVKYETIQNILHNRSKSPRFDNVQRILDIIEPAPYLSKNDDMHVQKKVELATQISFLIDEITIKNNVTLDDDIKSIYAKEIFRFTMKKAEMNNTEPVIERYFAEMLILG